MLGMDNKGIDQTGQITKLDGTRFINVDALTKNSRFNMSSKSRTAQSCLTLSDPLDYSPPGSSVHGILQARIQEWVALPSSRGSSQPRD